MISSHVKSRLRSQPEACPTLPRPLSTADLSASDSPFSTMSAKLNVMDKPDKKVISLSSTLPVLSKNKSSRDMKKTCVSTLRSDSLNAYNASSSSTSHSSTSRSSSSSDASAVRTSVSAGHEKLKIAIAKSMPRPLPKEKIIKKKTSLPLRCSDSGDETSDCESPSTVNRKSLTDAELRQVAIERANRAIQKQRHLANADKEQAALERQNRADLIESKLKQRNRHRAEVYAVNAILKKLEMAKFDEMREERGADRSFLENCTSDDDTSVEDNVEEDFESTKAGGKSDKNKSQKASGKLEKKGGKEAKEPTGSRPKQQSTRKLHISSEEKNKTIVAATSTCMSPASGGGAGSVVNGGFGAIDISVANVGAAPPPSTTESEVCNFSFGV